MALKESILLSLERESPRAVSGQRLAEENGVSRSAVWKAVKALRAEGYIITSTRNLGYSLPVRGERLSREEISAFIPGVPVYVYDGVDSTNNEAKRLLSGGEESFLVVAELQTAGRGRFGKSFVSPRGAGLYMSLAFHPHMDFAGASGITAWAAVCTVHAIKELAGLDCGIKWVNDVYLGGKKVCGILTEAATDFESGGLDSVIVGIGINLYTAGVPAELRGIAAGLDCGKPIKSALAGRIAAGLLAYDPSAPYMDEYRAHSIVLGRRVGYTLNGEKRSGTAAAIGDDGALIVRREDGETDELRSGELSLESIEGVK